MTFSCVHGASPAYTFTASLSSSRVCRGPCDAEVSQLRRTHWASHEEKTLQSMKFPCCCMHQLLGTVYRNTCVPMILLRVDHSFGNWRCFCLHGSTSQRRLSERSL